MSEHTKSATIPGPHRRESRRRQGLIPWKSGKFQGIRIEVDRGDGHGWTFLGVDTSPDFADTFPHPATVTIWKYRAFYIIDDQKVGQCSAVVEVKVGG